MSKDPNTRSIVFFSSKHWVLDSFGPKESQLGGFSFRYLEPKLDISTVSLAAGHDVVCVFVNDIVNAPVIDELARLGVKVIALRCAGFNNVDIPRAKDRGIAVVRVPAYSPYAVAEHALGLILALNRRYHRAYSRVHDGNFSLDGLLGFDIHGKTVGVIGTGRIGQVFVGLLAGFGVNVLAYDKFPSADLASGGTDYVELDELYAKSDIVSLHCPLIPETFHLVNATTISKMKRGVMIINTSRGALIDSNAVIDGLKSGQVGYLGLDVYEEEQNLFFEDMSDKIIQDDIFVRLETFPTVLITAHQAFFTKEAVDNIAETTLGNIVEFFSQGSCKNAVLP